MTVGWALALLFVVVVGLGFPPLGAALSLVLAALAGRAGQRGVMLVALGLAVVFVVVSIVVGTTLVSVGGGGSSDIGPVR